MKQIVDFGELPVFPEAATFPALFLTEKTKSSNPTIYTKVSFLDFGSLDDVINSDGLSLLSSAFEGDTWALSNVKETEIMRKMDLLGEPLCKFTDNKIRWGIKTGLNEAFIIDKSIRDKMLDEDAKNLEIIKPLVIGDDIRKYEINYQDQYIIFTKRDIDIEKYPAIKRHLERYKDRLTPKKNNNDKIGRKPGKYQWYEIQDTVDFSADFEKPKIVYPEISMESRFAADVDGQYFLNNKCFFIPRFDPYLLSILNSKATFFYILRICSILGDSQNSMCLAG
jgi:hypothetical protein